MYAVRKLKELEQCERSNLKVIRATFWSEEAVVFSFCTESDIVGVRAIPARSETKTFTCRVLIVTVLFFQSLFISNT